MTMNAYKINGVELFLQPTAGRWVPRKKLGVNGFGQTLYSPVASFEMEWGFSRPSGVHQIQEIFDGLGVSGSVMVDLPEFRGSAYTFVTYSGCYLEEPEESAYFNEFHSQVKVIINGITV